MATDHFTIPVEPWSNIVGVSARSPGQVITGEQHPSLWAPVGPPEVRLGYDCPRILSFECPTKGTASPASV